MFPDELNRIADLGDPEEMVRRLTEFDHKLAQAIGGQQASASDPSGAVTVTVDAFGAVVELTTTPAVGKIPPEHVGPTVLECIQRAQNMRADRIDKATNQSLADEPKPSPPNRRPTDPDHDEGWADNPIDWQRTGPGATSAPASNSHQLR